VEIEAAIIHPPQRPGWRSIDARAAELEQNPRRAAALARARQRLAGELLEQQNLAALRLRHGLSQAQLAKRVGTSQSRLSRIEAGMDDPRLSTLEKLAAALGEPIETVAHAIGAARGPHHD
jgi:DNA-binding XRE family transcriptional regulator